MRACWAATILVLAQPSPVFCATYRGTSVVPQVLALTHRRLHKSPCVRQPFVETSGSIAFSSLWFLSRKLCPIFVCQFKGSLHPRAYSAELFPTFYFRCHLPEIRNVEASTNFGDYRVYQDLEPFVDVPDTVLDAGNSGEYIGP